MRYQVLEYGALETCCLDEMDIKSNRMRQEANALALQPWLFKYQDSQIDSGVASSICAADVPLSATDVSSSAADFLFCDTDSPVLCYRYLST